MKHTPSDLLSFFSSPYEFLVRKYIKDSGDESIQLDPEDMFLNLLAAKGDDHELSILDDLKKDHQSIIDIDSFDQSSREDKTFEAMQNGIDVIYQGSLSNNFFYGKTDFLIKHKSPSDLGDYSYQILDAKLSNSVKPEHIIQICCYSEMLKDTIGAAPNEGFIITGDKSRERIFYDDFFSFYCLLKEEFLKVQNIGISSLPNAGDYSNWGKYSEYAKSYLREKDHLMQITNLRQSQVKKLNEVGINSITDLLNKNSKKPIKMEDKTFQKIWT